MLRQNRQSEKSFFSYRCPFGTLTIASNGKAITHIGIGVQNYPGQHKACTLTNKAANEILEYFSGKRREFSVPLEPYGTEFQKQVWALLQEIPYGQTRTAKDLALALGDEKKAQSVGIAIKKNPIALMIPSHRIIGANGRFPDATKQMRITSAILKEEIRICNTQENAGEGDSN